MTNNTSRVERAISDFRQKMKNSKRDLKLNVTFDANDKDQASQDKFLQFIGSDQCHNFMTELKLECYPFDPSFLTINLTKSQVMTSLHLAAACRSPDKIKLEILFHDEGIETLESLCLSNYNLEALSLENWQGYLDTMPKLKKIELEGCIVPSDVSEYLLQCFNQDGNPLVYLNLQGCDINYEDGHKNDHNICREKMHALVRNENISIHVEKKYELTSVLTANDDGKVIIFDLDDETKALLYFFHRLFPDAFMNDAFKPNSNILGNYIMDGDIIISSARIPSGCLKLTRDEISFALPGLIEKFFNYLRSKDRNIAFECTGSTVPMKIQFCFFYLFRHTGTSMSSISLIGDNVDADIINCIHECDQFQEIILDTGDDLVEVMKRYSQLLISNDVEGYGIGRVRKLTVSEKTHASTLCILAESLAYLYICKQRKNRTVVICNGKPVPVIHDVNMISEWFFSENIPRDASHICSEFIKKFIQPIKYSCPSMVFPLILFYINNIHMIPGILNPSNRNKRRVDDIKSFYLDCNPKFSEYARQLLDDSNFFNIYQLFFGTAEQLKIAITARNRKAYLQRFEEILAFIGSNADKAEQLVNIITTLSGDVIPAVYLCQMFDLIRASQDQPNRVVTTRQPAPGLVGNQPRAVSTQLVTAVTASHEEFLTMLGLPQSDRDVENTASRAKISCSDDFRDFIDNIFTLFKPQQVNKPGSQAMGCLSMLASKTKSKPKSKPESKPKSKDCFSCGQLKK